MISFDNDAIMTDSLEAALLDIVRDIKKEFKVFPLGCCTYSSGKVENRLGLEMIYGYFIGFDGLAEEHYWNIDTKTRTLIDITARQFDKSLPEVLMIPINSEYAEEHYVFL